jgi:hypothetical protein
MVRRPKVVTPAAMLLSAALLGGCAGPRDGTDPPDRPPAAARITVHPASRLPDGTAWPDDHRGTLSFVTQRTSPPGGPQRRVTWPRAAKAPSSVPSYALTERLPDLGDRADRLARALGLDPAARTRPDGTLRYEGAGDSVLVVATGGGQEWAFARDGAACTDVDGTATATLLAKCVRTGADRTSGSVSRHAARQRGRPVLAAVGVDVDATRSVPGGDGMLLYVDPTVAGSSTRGLATGVLVDRAGVGAATGWLGEATPVASYRVRPLSDLVAPDGVAAGGLRCASAGVAPECARPAVLARDVRLGYGPRWFGDTLRLVPVWLADDERARPLGALPAVEEDLLPAAYRQVPAH